MEWTVKSQDQFLPSEQHHQGAVPTTDNNLFLRTVRSFVTRAGRLTNSQRQALQRLSGQFVLPFQADPIDWHVVFQRTTRNILEIGFGMGDATAYIAEHFPNSNFLGVEVHQPGVGALLKRIEEKQLSNLRLIQYDAIEVVEYMIAPETLDGVHIFFPDPWHKKRHHKRRLIQTKFVSLLVSRLKKGGYIHCATDWQDYAEHILATLNAESLLSNTANGYAPRPDYRPITKFEQRGLRLGHGVWDLVFEKS